MVTNKPWCIIVNLSTCPVEEWEIWRALLDKNKIPFTAHLTVSIDQVSRIISRLLLTENKKFLFAGGDGTIHHGGNILLRLAGEKSSELTIGVLPCGTGNDWFRTFGVPEDKLVTSLKEGQTAPMNVIRITWPDGREHYAMNMVGGALDAAVVDSLLKSPMKFYGSLKYPIALIKTLLKSRRWNGEILVDEKSHSGNWLTMEAGFGKYCGGGMYVLPHAESDRAALLLMKPKSLLSHILSIFKLYNGKIAKQKEAMALHFTTLKINHSENPIPLEADGEWLGYTPVRLQTCYGVMQRLI